MSVIAVLLLVVAASGVLISGDDSSKHITEVPLHFPYQSKSKNDRINEAMLITFITFIVLFVVMIATAVIFCVVRKKLRLSDDELMREEENQAYLELNSDEQELYFQSKDYLLSNPYLRNDLTLSQTLLIQEKGIKAFEFQKDPMLTSNDLIIVNKVELNFFKRFECSAQSNLPIPMKNEVYYFESKVYSLPDPENTKISIGLAIKPYPWFRLPGRHPHSISYDSDGYRRHNQSFKFNYDAPFPKLIEGDVVGIGYRVRSGTIFFTRNGKKINESKIGGHIRNFKIPNNGQIFPTVGASNLCSVHVNLGQMGFVFIEGNVKKWGFAPLEGTGPAPPAYNKFNSDILLERSEIDDDNDLSERENDFPPDFWEIHGGNEDEPEEAATNHDKYSYNAYSDLNSNDERITLNSLLPSNKPPSYNSDDVVNEESSSRGENSNSEVTDSDNNATIRNEEVVNNNEPIDTEEVDDNTQLSNEVGNGNGDARNEAYDETFNSTSNSEHIEADLDNYAVNSSNNDDIDDNGESNDNNNTN